jgi:predicted  nucleic acid-binding Zn-ribbon protein
MMMMKDYKKEINILRKYRRTHPNRLKKLNKTIQDLKMKGETIKKSQSKTILEIRNLGKKSGAIDASITNRVQEIEEKISGAEHTIENIDKTIKENSNCKKILT